MLSWIAVHVEADRIEHDLEQRAASALHQAGHDWASVVFSGRDGVMVGTSPSRDDAREAIALVRSLWGVRVVEGRTRLAEEATPAAAIPAAAMPVAVPPSRAAPSPRVSVRQPARPPSSRTGKAALPPLGATVAQLEPAEARLAGGPFIVVTSSAAPVSLAEPAPDPVRAWEQETVTDSAAAADAEKTQDASRSVAVETAALAATSARSAEVCSAAVNTINAVETVRFGRGEFELDGHGRGVLDRFAESAGGCPGVVLRVVGHADARGGAKRNLALSKRRARAVVTYLIEKGIDAGRLKAVGYGEARPVAPNDTAQNRAKNRRIEVEITGASQSP
jgi:outer membrane protein OmpA-like peptidoglycan-associated protein